MNKFCTFLLFACVASSNAHGYSVGQPEYQSYPVSAPAPKYVSGAAYAPNLAVELPSYQGPEIQPAAYSHAAHAKYSQGNDYLPVKTFENIHGSKTVKAIWKNAAPLAKSYAQVQKPKAPKGKYQQFAVPGFKIVEIVVEPNYDADKHYSAHAASTAPAYQYETAYAPAPAAPAYAPAPAAPAYAHAPAAPAYAPAPAAPAYAPAPAAPAYAPAPAPAAPAYAPSAPAAAYVPVAPASGYVLSGPTYVSPSSSYAIVESSDDYAQSGPTYTSEVSY